MLPGGVANHTARTNPRIAEKAGARRYFEKAICQNGAPDTVTIDKSGANLAPLHAVNAQRATPIRVRQRK